MWSLISSFEYKGIKASSFRTIRSSVPGKYKLAIFFSSFESRCLTSSYLLHSNSCENSIIVNFKEKDTRGLREKYDKDLLSNVKNVTINRPLVLNNLSTIKIVESVEILINSIMKYPLDTNSKIFIDTAGSPIPFYLSILGFLRRLFQPPQVHLFNPTAAYARVNDISEFRFHSGFKNYIWVPWLWGNNDPTKTLCCLFLLGFEGERVISTLHRFEPEEIWGLFGQPGYSPEYVKIARTKNKYFLKLINQNNLIFSHAADPINTWKVLLSRLNKISNNSNLFIFPYGTKSHAIGAALLALSLGSPSVIYEVPQRFIYNDTKRGKYVWLYKIQL